MTRIRVLARSPVLLIMKAYIGNAFSLNMVSGDAMLQVSEVSPAQVPPDAESCIGHESTAKVVSSLFDREVPMRRVPVSLKPGDRIYVVTLFQKDGKTPFRCEEGQVLGEVELRELVLAIRCVIVLVTGDLTALGNQIA